jgi:hypothetical protein
MKGRRIVVELKATTEVSREVVLILDLTRDLLDKLPAGHLHPWAVVSTLTCFLD